MRAIAVSGTPGTGKTTLSKIICKRLNFDYIDVKPLIKALGEGYDNRRKCYVVDEDKLSKALIKRISAAKKPPLIDSHMSHFLPPRYVELCVVCKCNLKELKRRLEKKGYSKKKIRENLDCEIFDVCLNEAKEIGHKVVIIDTTKGIDEKTIKTLEKELKKVRT